MGASLHAGASPLDARPAAPYRPDRGRCGERERAGRAAFASCELDAQAAPSSPGRRRARTAARDRRTRPRREDVDRTLRPRSLGRAGRPARGLGLRGPPRRRRLPVARDAVRDRPLRRRPLHAFEEGQLGLKQHSFARQLVEDPDGSIWTALVGGVARYRGGRFEFFDEQQGLLHPFVYALARGASGSLWVGTGGSGVWLLRDGRFEHHPAYREPGLPAQVNALAVDRQGTVWVAAGDGVAALGASARRFTAKDGLASAVANAALVDRLGQVWIGTRAGLSRWDGSRFRTFTRRDGLSADDVTALLEDRDGTLWVGTRGGGLDRRTGERFERVDDDPSELSVLALAEDRDGSLWLGTDRGLERYRVAAFTTFGRGDGLADERLLNVAARRAGGLFVLDGSGALFVHEGVRARAVAPPGTIPGDGMLGMAEMPDGTLWIGGSVLHRLRHGRWDSFSHDGGEFTVLLPDGGHAADRGPDPRRRNEHAEPLRRRPVHADRDTRSAHARAAAAARPRGTAVGQHGRSRARSPRPGRLPRVRRQRRPAARRRLRAGGGRIGRPVDRDAGRPGAAEGRPGDELRALRRAAAALAAAPAPRRPRPALDHRRRRRLPREDGGSRGRSRGSCAAHPRGALRDAGRPALGRDLVALVRPGGDGRRPAVVRHQPGPLGRGRARGPGRRAAAAGDDRGAVGRRPGPPAARREHRRAGARAHPDPLRRAQPGRRRPAALSLPAGGLRRGLDRRADRPPGLLHEPAARRVHVPCRRAAQRRQLGDAGGGRQDPGPAALVRDARRAARRPRQPRLRARRLLSAPRAADAAARGGARAQGRRAHDASCARRSASAGAPRTWSAR